ncbi:17 kDa surface antigen family protein [Mycobacteroides abscessus subsp. massiliense]|nr:17 kDa surface antigen family protein [Mycobacteroides abscessus subsp. massiliense]
MHTGELAPQMVQRPVNSSLKPLRPLRSVSSIAVSEKRGQDLNPHYFWLTWEYTLTLDCGHTQIRARMGDLGADSPKPETLRPPLPKKVRCKDCPPQRCPPQSAEPKFDQLLAALIAALCQAIPSERSALLSWAAAHAGHINDDTIRARAHGALALVGVDALLAAGAQHKIGSRVRAALAQWADDPIDDHRDEVRRAARHLADHVGRGEPLLDGAIVQSASVLSPFPHNARGIFTCITALGADAPAGTESFAGLLAGVEKLTAAQEDSVWGELRQTLGDDLPELDESHGSLVAAMLAAHIQTAPQHGIDAHRLTKKRRLLKKSERPALRTRLREQIARSRSGPLDERGWSTAVDGIRQCYELADVPWHENIARVSSPLVGALVASYASDWLIRQDPNGPTAVSLFMSNGPSEIAALAPEVIEKTQSLVAAADPVDCPEYYSYRDKLRILRPLEPFHRLTRAVDLAVSHTFVAGAELDDKVAESDAEASLVRQAVGMDLDRLINTEPRFDYRLTNTRHATRWNHQGFNLGGLQSARRAHHEYAVDILGDALSPLVRRRWAALHAAATGGPWWAYRTFAVICDRPTLVRPNHASSRPFMQWADGWRVYRHRGIAVPRWVVTSPTVKDALAEDNTEIRRLALEQIGWPRVFEELGEPPLDRCSDPGNPGAELLLYKLPGAINPFARAACVLVMTNGSPDRDGDKRIYGETVPPHMQTALEAAAWQYGLPVEVYAKLARRT